VQERAEWAVDQRSRLVEGEVAHVALTQVELRSRLGRPGARLLEYRRRGVDADDAPSSRQRDRDGDPAVSDCKLEKWPVRLPCESDVEGDVLGHVGRPFVVAARVRFVPAHRPMLRPGDSRPREGLDER